MHLFILFYFNLIYVFGVIIDRSKIVGSYVRNKVLEFLFPIYYSLKNILNIVSELLALNIS